MSPPPFGVIPLAGANNDISSERAPTDKGDSIIAEIAGAQKHMRCAGDSAQEH
jgi:hypothetical protein